MAIVLKTAPVDPPATGGWTQTQEYLAMLFLGQNGSIARVLGGYVVQGSVFYIGGAVYYATSDTAITGTPSDYVKITPSGSTASAAYATNLSGVTWSKDYNGWYDGTGNLYLFDELKAVQAGDIAEAKISFAQMREDGSIGQATTGAALGATAEATTGGAIGDSASSTTGGAAGASAAATTGGAIGASSEATTGGAAGAGAATTTGGAIGASASATTGAAVGAGAAETAGGGAVGNGADATSGGAVGDEASATTGGAVGDGASATTGGAVGTASSTTTGGAVGNGATASSGGGAVGNGATALSGGGAVGIGAEASEGGGAVGGTATAETGGAVGLGADATDGGAVGYAADATTGGAVGAAAIATTGGAVGAAASATVGAAIGAGAITTVGFAGGWNASANGTNRSALGNDATSTADNQIRIGNADNNIVDGNGASITSDRRDKTDIANNDLGLDFIAHIPTKVCHKNPRELYFLRDENGKLITDEKGRPTYDVEAHERGDKKGKRLHRVVIAQEIEELFDSMQFAAVKHMTVNDPNAFDEYAVNYTEFIVPMIKAIQELKAKVEELEAQT
jgi:hypothetical protein